MLTILLDSSFPGDVVSTDSLLDGGSNIMTCPECWKYTIQCTNCLRRFPSNVEQLLRETDDEPRRKLQLDDYTEQMEVEDAAMYGIPNLEAPHGGRTS